MNDEDRDVREELYRLYCEALELAQPETVTSLEIRLDRHGHICRRDSGVRPGVVRLTNSAILKGP